jgi:hypothetical protein
MMYANQCAPVGMFHTRSMIEEMKTAVYMITLTMKRLPVSSLIRVRMYVDTTAVCRDQHDDHR